MASLFNKTQNKTIVADVLEARSFADRAKGLLGRDSLDNNVTLWIHSCTSIHTFFMKFAIDAVFVDKDLNVKAIYQDLKPWRMTLIQPGASSVFEFNAGVIKDQVHLGDQLHVGT